MLVMLRAWGDRRGVTSTDYAVIAGALVGVLAAACAGLLGPALEDAALSIGL